MIDPLEQELFEEARAELDQILGERPLAPSPTPAIGGEPITLEEAELMGIYRTMLHKQRVEWRRLGIRLLNPAAAVHAMSRKPNDRLPRSQKKGG